MRITQGAFSYLPDLTDLQIARQVRYCVDRGWAVSLEFTDDPHPRNTYWEMWETPMFDLKAPDPVMAELAKCRKACGDRYIRLSAFDSSPGWEFDPALLHRQPPDAGARFPPHPAGRRGP